MITVVTTFSEHGYHVYGNRWINSICKFWPESTKVIIYTDFALETPASNFTIKQFNEEFPDHNKFKEVILQTFNKNEKSVSVANKTIKFSYKGFVICNELLNSDSKYLVWLDGDAETVKPIPTNLLNNLVSDKFLACQQEKNYQHVESGALFFNLYHPLAKEFANDFKEYYFNHKLVKLKKPYDGYVIADILKNTKYNYIDLNAGFNFQDKKSKKEDTFLHPLLKEHFVHWIGTAKA